jgi:multicomponent Na+:H+ antiporter subunit G
LIFILDTLSWIFLVGGSFFSIVGGVGIVRLPEFYSRMHGGGITDTLGAGMIVIGLVFQAPVIIATPKDATLVIVKLLMILFFLAMTSPSSCHALAKSALSQGLEPELEINSVKSNKPPGT